MHDFRIRLRQKRRVNLQWQFRLLQYTIQIIALFLRQQHRHSRPQTTQLITLSLRRALLVMRLAMLRIRDAIIQLLLLLFVFFMALLRLLIIYPLFLLFVGDCWLGFVILSPYQLMCVPFPDMCLTHDYI